MVVRIARALPHEGLSPSRECVGELDDAGFGNMRLFGVSRPSFDARLNLRPYLVDAYAFDTVACG